jgi:hypothetical protein
LTTKAIKLKLTDEQLAWVEQAAADEGIDSSTFVRMMIDRLSKGRAPLISQMVVADASAQASGHYPTNAEISEYIHQSGARPLDLAPQFSDLGAADPATVRAALAREPEREFEVNWEAAKDTAAISLRKVQWDPYNPLPK